MSTIYVTRSAIRQALSIVCSGLAISQDGKSIEVSGLLLGAEIPNGIVITSAVAGEQVSTELASKLDENFMARIAHDMATGKTKGRIVGLFHSHPGIGIFMSQQDVRTLANFQRLYPNFVMMVIDPLDEDFERCYTFFRYHDETGSAQPFAVDEI
ncbi:MAG: Mov34/MPN/PAD-1 family protein [Candidatus Bathyarchaeia archaeon]|jgi:proteasome lid subunit RPN8/RPN11